MSVLVVMSQDCCLECREQEDSGDLKMVINVLMSETHNSSHLNQERPVR